MTTIKKIDCYFLDFYDNIGNGRIHISDSPSYTMLDNLKRDKEMFIKPLADKYSELNKEEERISKLADLDEQSLAIIQFEQALKNVKLETNRMHKQALTFLKSVNKANIKDKKARANRP